MTVNSEHPIVFNEIAGQNGDLGVMTLNRPKVLNAINHHIVNGMYAQLTKWSNAAHIKAVVIRAVPGRAFCAGGDIRLTYERAKENDPEMLEFFRREYELNQLIFYYPKPYIALLDGITMGGGAGISINGSHRVATDNILFAMPETGIGFFPDVGGTYFLPRLPGYLGFYLGLTGARIKEDDCVMLGIAQSKVQAVALEHLLNALAAESFGENAHEGVTHIIKQFYQPVISSPLMQYKKIIDDCFSLPTMEEIIAALKNHSSEFAEATFATLTKQSPTSLKVTLRALQQGKRLDFQGCMEQEYRLAARFLLSHDFLEGIRAVIIEKDQQPRWSPASLTEVNDIDTYFSPLK